MDADREYPVLPSLAMGGAPPLVPVYTVAGLAPLLRYLERTAMHRGPGFDAYDVTTYFPRSATEAHRNRPPCGSPQYALWSDFDTARSVQLYPALSPGLLADVEVKRIALPPSSSFGLLFPGMRTRLATVGTAAGPTLPPQRLEDALVWKAFHMDDLIPQSVRPLPASEELAYAGKRMEAVNEIVVAHALREVVLLQQSCHLLLLVDALTCHRPSRPPPEEGGTLAEQEEWETSEYQARLSRLDPPPDDGREGGEYGEEEDYEEQQQALRMSLQAGPELMDRMLKNRVQNAVRPERTRGAVLHSIWEAGERTLAAYLQATQTALNASELRDYLFMVAQGMHAGYEAGYLVHHDLVPENVLLTPLDASLRGRTGFYLDESTPGTWQSVYRASERPPLAIPRRFRNYRVFRYADPLNINRQYVVYELTLGTHVAKIAGLGKARYTLPIQVQPGAARVVGLGSAYKDDGQVSYRSDPTYDMRTLAFALLTQHIPPPFWSQPANQDLTTFVFDALGGLSLVVDLLVTLDKARRDAAGERPVRPNLSGTSDRNRCAAYQSLEALGRGVRALVSSIVPPGLQVGGMVVAARRLALQQGWRPNHTQQMVRLLADQLGPISSHTPDAAVEYCIVREQQSTGPDENPAYTRAQPSPAELDAPPVYRPTSDRWSVLRYMRHMFVARNYRSVAPQPGRVRLTGLTARQAMHHTLFDPLVVLSRGVLLERMSATAQRQHHMGTVRRYPPLPQAPAMIGASATPGDPRDARPLPPGHGGATMSDDVYAKGAQLDDALTVEEYRALMERDVSRRMAEMSDDVYAKGAQLDDALTVDEYRALMERDVSRRMAEMKNAAPTMRTCQYCHAHRARISCARCGKAFYCGEDCRHEAWLAGHRITCH